MVVFSFSLLFSPSLSLLPLSSCSHSLCYFLLLPFTSYFFSFSLYSVKTKRESKEETRALVSRQSNLYSRRSSGSFFFFHFVISYFDISFSLSLSLCDFVIIVIYHYLLFILTIDTVLIIVIIINVNSLQE